MKFLKRMFTSVKLYVLVLSYGFIGFAFFATNKLSGSDLVAGILGLAGTFYASWQHDKYIDGKYNSPPEVMPQ